MHANPLIETCDSSIKRLKQGPPSFTDIISEGRTYEDDTFNGRDMLYWFGYNNVGKSFLYEFEMFIGSMAFQRVGDVYPDATMFGSNPQWHDIIQGEAGTCYIEASLASIAEFPDLVKNVFVT